ncbi:hypothetical protein J4427_01235 [Candidatus Woesearchaeota archaeon]|nr:hypothetical protein [Candidatus Woesearchaeota archaeon]
MDKRGQEKEYLFLFYIVLAAVVGAIVISFIVQVREDARYEMQRLAIDSAFLIDSISASPIDLNVKTSFAKEGYSISFNNKPCIISANEQDEKLNPYSLYCFSDLDFKNNDIKSLFINFKKEGNIIKISNEKGTI